MTNLGDNKELRPWLRLVASGCATISVLLGLVALGSALLGDPESGDPTIPQMAPATAMASCLGGVALWLRTMTTDWELPRARRVWLIQSLALIVATFGAVRLVGWAVGFEHLVLGGGAERGFGTTSPATAVGFVFVGLAMLPRGLQQQWSADVAGLVCVLVGWLGLSRYIYGGEPIDAFGAMSVQTSIGLVALGMGAGCTQPRGLAYLVTGRSSASVIARRLIRVALLGPLMLGLLYLHGLRNGWWSNEAGVSLLTLGIATGIGATTWWAIVRLERTDQLRTKAERRVISQLERMKLLHEITAAMARRQDLESTHHVVTAHLIEQFEVHLVSILLCDFAQDQLVCRNTQLQGADGGSPAWLAVGAKIPIGSNGLARCLDGELVYEPDTAGLPYELSQKVHALGLNSLVLAPLQVDSESVGVMLVAGEQAQAFSSTDCEFFRHLGDHVALSIRQAELHRSLTDAYEDLRQTRDAMSKQERLSAVGQLASGIAHDINNAITPVGMFADIMLEEETNLSETGREYLQVIGSAVQDVGETLSRLRRFYRPPAEDVMTAEVSLNSIADETLELTKARWLGEPNRRVLSIEVVRDFAHPLPTIQGSPSELRDAVTNLILNAIDAMPTGGTLAVTTMSRKGRIILQVADTGAGMDEATQQRCLEPFYTTKGEHGTGLGLAMVHDTTQRHGGTLEIESVPAQGTTMRMSFPPSREHIERPDSEAVYPRKVRLLVVDDDPVILRALDKVLTADGHDIVLAGGGREALEAFLRQQGTVPFDGVLTDYGMPHLDGAALAAAIKKACPEMPVFMLTGWGARLNEERTAPEHVDQVLSKPLRHSALRAMLAARFGAAERDASTGVTRN